MCRTGKALVTAMGLATGMAARMRTAQTLVSASADWHMAEGSSSIQRRCASMPNMSSPSMETGGEQPPPVDLAGLLQSLPAQYTLSTNYQDRVAHATLLVRLKLNKT